MSINNKFKRNRIIILLIILISFPTTYFLWRTTMNHKFSALPQEYRTSPLISGAFVQYTSLNTWNYSKWGFEFSHFHDIGVNTLILQWVHDAQTNKTLYRSKYFEFDNSSVSEYLIPPSDNPYNYSQDSDVLRAFVCLAEKYNISIYIGLSADWNFWKAIKNQNQTYINSMLNINKLLAGEILEICGNTSVFKGFYIPYEVFMGSKADANDGIIYGDFFGNLSAVIRNQINIYLNQMNLPEEKTFKIMAAPYAEVPSYIPNGLDFVYQFLNRSNLDIVMVQDGVGVHRNELRELPTIYNIFHQIAEKLNITFWSDLEIFDMDPTSSNILYPANISRIEDQLDIEARFVNKIIIFDIPHYMSLLYSEQSSILYNAYLNYTKTKK